MNSIAMTSLVISMLTMFQSLHSQKRLWTTIGLLKRKVRRLQDEVEEHNSSISEESEESEASSMSTSSTTMSSTTSATVTEEDESDSRGL